MTPHPPPAQTAPGHWRPAGSGRLADGGRPARACAASLRPSGRPPGLVSTSSAAPGHSSARARVVPHRRSADDSALSPRPCPTRVHLRSADRSPPRGVVCGPVPSDPGGGGGGGGGAASPLRRVSRPERQLMPGAAAELSASELWSRQLTAPSAYTGTGQLRLLTTPPSPTPSPLQPPPPPTRPGARNHILRQMSAPGFHA